MVEEHDDKNVLSDLLAANSGLVGAHMMDKLINKVDKGEKESNNYV